MSHDPCRVLLMLIVLTCAAPAAAQERPPYGRELVFTVPSEPPSYDGHREGPFGTVHPLAPMCNTLLRIDPTDRTGTRPVPDLAESWAISPDGLTYTFNLRQCVSATAACCPPAMRRRATTRSSGFPQREGELRQDHLPDDGVISARKGACRPVEVVEAPDPFTVRFRVTSI